MKVKVDKRSFATSGEHEIRVVKRANGTNIVVHYFGGGCSWSRYIAFRRDAVLANVRRLRRLGYRWNQIDVFDCLPEQIGGEHYGGPGRSFQGRPYRIRAGRRFIVFQQSGGLDI